MDLEELGLDSEDELGLDSEDYSFDDIETNKKKQNSIRRPKKRNQREERRRRPQPVVGQHKRASSTTHLQDLKVERAIGKRRNTIVSEFDPALQGQQSGVRGQGVGRMAPGSIIPPNINASETYSYLSSQADFDPRVRFQGASGRVRGGDGDQNCALI